jgi:hypothetical protein
MTDRGLFVSSFRVFAPRTIGAVPGTICENQTRPIRAVPVSRCEPSTDRDTNENVVATKNTTAASPLDTGNRGAEWSGGETLLAG